MPLVSVIIPTFNRLELLKQTIESVRSQTFRDFELLVVNDGSEDGTKEWLAAQNDVLAINQPNAGIAASRNRGAAVSRGRWLAFLDHDDLWESDKLEIQIKFTESYPAVGLVAARHIRLGSRCSRSMNPKWIQGDLFAKEYTESFIHTSSVLIRRDVFREIGGFPTKYNFADEFDVWLKIAHDYPIAFTYEPLVHIRFYESNTSHNRVGVRTDTYDILQKNYDPTRISKAQFRKTMSDHDISFGRAYISMRNYDKALEFFKTAISRTPFRMRAWRYYIRYWLISKVSKH